MDKLEITIILSGVQLLTLIGLFGKIWAWSMKLEHRLTAMETHIDTLVRRHETCYIYKQITEREVQKNV